MARQVDFTMKTRGWKVDSATNDSTSGTSDGSTGVIYAEADYYTLTMDGRLAFCELQQTDMTGIEVRNEVCFPQGWSIQEASIPTAYVDAATSFATEGAPTTLKPGLPAELECYDIWSTKKLREVDFDQIVMKSDGHGYNQVFPGFMSVFDLGTLTRDPYWDQEQIICGRSRYWNVSADISRTLEQADAAVRKFPMNLIHDLSWGLMEPMAVSLLHHARIWRMSVTSHSAPNTRFQPNTSWFYTLPASNQPMVTLAEEPDFVSRMTMERRSRDV